MKTSAPIRIFSAQKEEGAHTRNFLKMLISLFWAFMKGAQHNEPTAVRETFLPIYFAIEMRTTVQLLHILIDFLK